MKWVNVNEKLPPKHPEFNSHSVNVLVSDGERWGHGVYYYDYNCEGSGEWVYTLIEKYEKVSNDIIKWAMPPLDVGNDTCPICGRKHTRIYDSTEYCYVCYELYCTDVKNNITNQMNKSKRYE